MENKLDFLNILEMIEASYDGNIGELKEKLMKHLIKPSNV